VTKDLKSARTEPLFTLVSIILPLNVLLLMSLLVVSGGQAPTAVVMLDSGPLAQQFYTSMQQAHSFVLQRATISQANALLHEGKIVAIVTIPADFDTRVEAHQRVSVGVTINNLNTDFTNDIRRAVPLAITSFYAKAEPSVVTITPAGERRKSADAQLHSLPGGPHSGNWPYGWRHDPGRNRGGGGVGTGDDERAPSIPGQSGGDPAGQDTRSLSACTYWRGGSARRTHRGTGRPSGPLG
jgi:hypothetical protein